MSRENFSLHSLQGKALIGFFWWRSHGFRDAIDTTPKSSDQTETQKPDEEIVVVSKKAETGVKEKNKSRKKNPKVGFGSHVPSKLSRKKGETDAEFINKVQKNLRRIEDPLEPKKTRKSGLSSRLKELAKPKNETKINIFPIIRLK